MTFVCGLYRFSRMANLLRVPSLTKSSATNQSVKVSRREARSLQEVRRRHIRGSKMAKELGGTIIGRVVTGILEAKGLADLGRTQIGIMYV